MTDRYDALIVVLDHDIREDDAQQLIDAIKMLKSVISVSGNVANIDSHIAKTTAKFELQQKLLEVLK